VEQFLQLFVYDADKPLLFNSGLFLMLFLVFYGLYLLLQGQPKLRIIYTLVFSLYFYYKSSGQYLWILVLSTLIDFFLGNAIHQSQTEIRRKFFLVCSLCGNLGLLGYFKYTNFLIDSFNQLSGTQVGLQEIFLPVGISFYTFQTLSYSIDIYRRQIEPCKNIFDFAFFVSFFPQLVAGPIVRASEFIPQIKNKLDLTESDLNRAFILISGGLVKKAVISDYISVNFVDRVFDNPLLYSSFENLMAVYGYTIQIYCDFSGYSDMAIGLALLCGFKLTDNFNLPYQAMSITDFWRRWHISLSTWLRDYLYISMGGNRVNKWRTYLHLMLTMLIGGLWHGASWKFVVWGGLHGLALVIEKRFSLHQTKNPSTIKRLFRQLLVFHFVAFCWIFFRAENFSLASQIIKKTISVQEFTINPAVFEAYRGAFMMILFGYLLHFLPSHYRQKTESQLSKMSIIPKSIMFALVIWTVFQLSNADVQPFIYFDF
jgi:D-alanyl-lipoteichoic acid acyltransferase DltB (MBOAT superfamily)